MRVHAHVSVRIAGNKSMTEFTEINLKRLTDLSPNSVEEALDIFPLTCNVIEVAMTLHMYFDKDKDNKLAYYAHLYYARKLAAKEEDDIKN